MSIYYNSILNEYSFSKASLTLSILNVTSVEDTEKGEIYNIKWNGDTVASIEKEEIDYNQSYAFGHDETSSDENTTSIPNSYSGTYDAKLKYGSGSVLICISEDAMDRYMTALNEGYQGTIDEMISSGEIAYTERNTKCNIVEKKFTRCKVKLLDGSYAGNTVWTINEALQKE